VLADEDPATRIDDSRLERVTGLLVGSSGEPRRAGLMRLRGRRLDLGRIDRILLVVAASVDRVAPLYGRVRPLTWSRRGV
jgi:hypothetical protein